MSSIPGPSPAALNKIIADYLKERVTDAPLRPATQAYIDAGLLAVEGSHVRDYDIHATISDAKAPLLPEKLKKQLLRAAERRPIKAFHAGDSYSDAQGFDTFSSHQLHDLMAGINLKLLTESKGAVCLSDALLRQDFSDTTRWSKKPFDDIAEAMQKHALSAPDEQALSAAFDTQGDKWLEIFTQALHAYYDRHKPYIAQAKQILGLQPDAEIDAERYKRLEFLKRGEIWASQASDSQVKQTIAAHPGYAGKIQLARQIAARLRDNASNFPSGAPMPELITLREKRAAELINVLPDAVIDTLTAGDISFRYSPKAALTPQMRADAAAGKTFEMINGEFKHAQGVGFISEGPALLSFLYKKLGIEQVAEQASSLSQKSVDKPEVTMIHETGHVMHLWDFVNHRINNDAKMPEQAMRELGDRMEKILADDPLIKTEFMQFAGATEARWQRLRDLAVQCRGIMHLDSAYYKQHYDDKQVALEVVADYIAIRHTLANDDPALLAFVSPGMNVFYEELLADAARQRDVIKQKQAAEVIPPDDAVQLLWKAEQPHKFTNTLSRSADTAQRS